MFTIDVANTIFVVCLALGGILLLVAVPLRDVLGGILDGIGTGFGDTRRAFGDRRRQPRGR